MTEAMKSPAKNRNHLISFLTHEESLSILTEISSRLEEGELEEFELDDLVEETFRIRKREEAEMVTAATRIPRRAVEDEDWG